MAFDKSAFLRLNLAITPRGHAQEKMANAGVAQRNPYPTRGYPTPK
jgi:hypothetical protein